MSEAKFTRGEWSAEFNGVYYDIESLNDGVSVGNTCATSCNGDIEQGRINASLMAAAPELYNALNDLVEMDGDNAKYILENSDYFVELLAKARGEK